VDLEQTIRVNLEDADTVHGIAELQKVLASAGIVMEKFARSAAKFNDQGELIGATVSGLLNPMTKLAATVNRLEDDQGKLTDEWVTQNLVLAENTSEINKNAAAAARQQRILDQRLRTQRAFRAQAQRDASATAFAATLGGQLNLGGLDPNKLSGIQNILAGFQQSISAGKISAAELTKLFNDVQSSGVNALTNVDANTRKFGASMLRLNALLHQNEEATRSVILSWRNLGRIAQFQLFTAGVGLLLFQVAQGADVFAQLQTSIAQIQTLSLDASKSTAAWSDELRKLSEEFGLDQIDAAKAAYDALSNQITDAANSFFFLREAATFAKLTVTDLTNAQNLLSSALNSYNLSQIETQAVAATLFKLIDLGRVTAEEMANSFGVLTATTSQAGLSFQETSAAIAALTIQGIKYNVAATLISNVSRKLIDPTVRMKEIFREWGVATGEAAIATFGFIGVLERLNAEVTKGGATELAEIFSDVRAIRGGGALIEDIEQVNTALEEMGAAGANVQELAANLRTMFAEAEAGSRIIEKSLGLDFERTVQRLKNIFINDVGGAIVRSIQEMNASIGGADKLVLSLIEGFRGLFTALSPITKSMELLAASVSFLGDGTFTLGAALGGLGIAFTVNRLQIAIWQSQVLTATGVVTGLAAAMIRLRTALAALGGPLGLIITGAAVALAELINLDSQADTIREDTAARINRLEQDRIERLRRDTAIELQIIQQVNEARLRAVQRFFNAINVATNKANEGLLTVIDPVIKQLQGLETLDKTFAALIKPEQVDSVKALELTLKALSTSADNLQSAELDKFLLGIKEGNLGAALDDLQTLFEVLGDQSAAPVQNISTIRDTMDQIEKTIQAIRSEKLKVFEDARRDLERSLELIEDIKSTAEDDIFSAGLEGKSASAKATALQARVEELLAQASGAANPDEARAIFERAESAAKAQVQAQIEAQRKLKDLGVNTDIDTGAISAVAAARLEFEKKFAATKEAFLQGEVAAKAQLQAAEQKLLDARIQIEKDFQAQLQQRAVIEQNILRTQEEQLRVQQQAIESFKQLSQLQKDLPEKIGELKTDELSKTAEAIGLLDALQSNVTKDRLSEDISQSDFLNLLGQFGEIAGDKTQLTSAEVEKILVLLKQLNDIELNETVRGLFGGDKTKEVLGTNTVREAIQVNIDQFQKLLEKQKELSQAEKDIAAVNAQLNARNDLAKAMGINIDAMIQLQGTSVQTANQLVNDFGRQLQAIQANIAAARALRVELQGLPGGGGNLPGRALGGGIPGRDNMLIRAHAGETILNRRASKQYASQLAAMNAGFAPRFANGGVVGGNQFSFGDTNITVQDSRNPDATVRAIGRGLQKEIRRGNLRWRN
jgi:hypothetical protein